MEVTEQLLNTDELKESSIDDRVDDRIEEIKQKIEASYKKKQELRKEINGLDVIIHLWLQSLSNIDSSSQTFQCFFEFKMFRELSKSELIEFDKNPDTFEPKMPYIFPLHAQEITQCEMATWYNGKTWHLRWKGNKVYVFTMWVFNVTFSETFELQNFPFDVQHFNIAIQVDGRDMNNSPNYHNINRINEKFNINDEECKMTLPSDATNLLGWDFVDNPHLEMCNESAVNDSIITFNGIFALKRDWHFYASRVIVVLAIMSFLAIFALLFEDHNMSDVYGYISTVLLGAIAYMFIVTSFLPPLKYFTLVDYYIFFVFFFIFFISMQCAVVNGIVDKQKWDQIYDILFFINLGLWTICQFIFLYQSIRAYQTEIQKFEKAKFEIDIDSKWYWMQGNTQKDQSIKIINARNKSVYVKNKFL